MKLKNKVISLLLVFCLVMGFMPTPALAAGTGKAIQLGTDALSTNVNTTSAAKVYFGKNARNKPYMTYYVIGYKLTGLHESIYSVDWAMLLAEEAYYEIKFDINNENYRDSLLNETMNNVALRLTEEERNAIQPRTLKSSVYYDDPPYSGGISGDEVPNALIWPLSTDEAYYVDSSVRKLGVNPDVSTSDWWLRSPGLNSDIIISGPLRKAAYVTSDGNLRPQGASISNVYAVRPAFYLKLNSVLFTFAAQGGKPSGKIGELSEVPNYDGNEWRLTLLDDSRNFAVTEQTISGKPGDTITLNYTGAQTGDYEYVSVLLCDSNGAVLYYGNIAQNSEYGTAKLTIPSELTAGNYTLKVFSEQCNRNNNYSKCSTDYASAFQDISLEILPREETPNASFTATSDSGGILSNVDTNMRYSVDGGETWNNITGTTMEITDVLEEKDVKVYRIGDGTNTADSAVQTIDVTQAVISDEIIDRINIKNCTTWNTHILDILLIFLILTNGWKLRVIR